MKILLAVASLIPILPLVPEVLGSASGEPPYLNAAPMPDFGAAREEAVRFLSGYLRIDTINPPGNETRGAQYLHSLLARDGITDGIFEVVSCRRRKQLSSRHRLHGGAPLGQDRRGVCTGRRRRHVGTGRRGQASAGRGDREALAQHEGGGPRRERSRFRAAGGQSLAEAFRRAA